MHHYYSYIVVLTSHNFLWILMSKILNLKLFCLNGVKPSLCSYFKTVMPAVGHPIEKKIGCFHMFHSECCIKYSVDREFSSENQSTSLTFHIFLNVAQIYFRCYRYFVSMLQTLFSNFVETVRWEMSPSDVRALCQFQNYTRSYIKPLCHKMHLWNLNRNIT